MQNWKVLQKKISEMSKEEFIDFISKYYSFSLTKIIEMFNIEWSCVEQCRIALGNCKICYEKVLEQEYQPPKQEK